MSAAGHPSRRIAALRERLGEAKLNALYVSALPNIRYLTGFTGSAGQLLISRDEAVLYVDGRYDFQAREQTRATPDDGAAIAIEVRVSKKRSLVEFAEDLPKRLPRRLGFERNRLGFGSYEYLRSASKKIRWVPVTDWVEELRMVKEAGEVEAIRRSLEVNSAAFGRAIGRLRPSWTETRLAGEIEYQMRLLGAEKAAFDTIVASGAHSALPHASPRPVSIARNSLVVVDQGAILDGYASDMTRMVALGVPNAAEREMVDAVRESLEAAIDAVGPGIQAASVDAKARATLKKRGLDRHFLHSTGHGLGLEIHEGPTLAKKQKIKLKPGMVVTIEPGVYKEGIGGVRIEDVVVVTDTGCEVLTTTDRSLIIL